MVRTLPNARLKAQMTRTHQGAAAYDYSDEHPLIHLTFTFGSALFTDGFYETGIDQVRRFAGALIQAARAEVRFPWQYAAWMRDPAEGKGNRIQGSLTVALLDALLPADLRDEAIIERYTAMALGHRVDDVTACLTHYERLGLDRPSAAVRRGMARALAGFDEYQLMKYAAQKADVRLCDVILHVRQELEALGADGALALAAGQYLHAPTRARKSHPMLSQLPLTLQRKALWRMGPQHVLTNEFAPLVAHARVTWEQVLGHFGRNPEKTESPRALAQARKRNRAIWQAMLDAPGLMPDMALLRNLRNLSQAGFSQAEISAALEGRAFKGVWPHQVYAGYLAEPPLEGLFNQVFQRTVSMLPPGRHLGIGDASGSMYVPVGGKHASLKAMDVAFCLVGLMSETSGLGASFSDSGFAHWSGGRCLSLVRRSKNESALAFSSRPALRKGMGGTQVFGAVMELIHWLTEHPRVQPPDCLWFFSDMQFHPAGGAEDTIPRPLRALAKRYGLRSGEMPPLELALKLYRAAIGPVDVVLWNLAAYAPVPVPGTMDGVLLVSGFDAQTFQTVARWRAGGGVGAPGQSLTGGAVVENQEAVLGQIRRY